MSIPSASSASRCSRGRFRPLRQQQSGRQRSLCQQAPAFERQRYAETGVNDAGNVYLGFDVGDVANNTVAYRMTGKIAGGDGYSDGQHGWRGFISPSVTWKPDEATSLTILANYSHIDENHNGGSFLPYEGTVVDRVVGGVNYGRIDRDANFFES